MGREERRVKILKEVIIRYQTEGGRIVKAYEQGELIRCKDCKYWKKSELLGGDMICDYAYFHKYYRNADDFCSKAERKEE